MDPRGLVQRSLAVMATAILVGCGGGGSPPPATPTIAPATPGASGTETPAVSPATATTSPRATLDSTSAPAAPALTWTLAPIPAMFEGRRSWPVAVAAGDDVYSTVGGRAFRDVDTPSGGVAGAWRSTDGLAWTPAATKGLAVGDAIPMDDYPQPGLIDVGWGPSGFVGLGVALEPDGRVGATWASPDGRAWQRTRLPEPSLARPAAVAWSGSTYVVVGVANEPDAPRAAVWLATDGDPWRRVPDQEDFAIGGYITYPAAIGSGGPVDVAAAPDGSIVAVGRTCAGTSSMEEPSVCRPYAIGSDDGKTWTTLPVPADEGVVLLSVATTNTRTVAIAQGTGADEESARVVVGDADGWRLVEPPGVPSLARVIPYADGFLALSRASDVIGVWWSSDGAAWSALPGVPQPPGVESLAGEVDLTARGGSVVIVVTAETADADDAGGYAIVGSR